MASARPVSDFHNVTLIHRPGDRQQAVRVVPAERDDLRDRAVQIARSKFGSNADLAWLDHATMKLTKVPSNGAKKVLKKKGK